MLDALQAANAAKDDPGRRRSTTSSSSGPAKEAKAAAAAAGGSGKYDDDDEGEDALTTDAAADALAATRDGRPPALKGLFGEDPPLPTAAGGSTAAATASSSSSSSAAAAAPGDVSARTGAAEGAAEAMVGPSLRPAGWEEATLREGVLLFTLIRKLQQVEPEPACLSFFTRHAPTPQTNQHPTDTSCLPLFALRTTDSPRPISTTLLTPASIHASHTNPQSPNQHPTDTSPYPSAGGAVAAAVAVAAQGGR